MNKEQLERKTAKLTFKHYVREFPKRWEEEKNELIHQILKSETPNWNIKFNLL